MKPLSVAIEAALVAFVPVAVVERLVGPSGPLSVLFATFQIEMFKSIERWIEFARDEIAAWPDTRDLGMTDRTETLTRFLASDTSPVEPPLPPN